MLVVLMLLTAGVFVSGWVLGGRNREKTFRIKGLSDVNEHYKQMAEDFNRVDRTIDYLKSSFLRELPDASKVPPPERTSSGDETKSIP